MSLSLDDKLLGEKVNNYCSSSEDESEDSDGDSTEKSDQRQSAQDSQATEVGFGNYSGHCAFTGPKGVITDFREYKRLETEKKVEQETERLALMKTLSMTCRSHLADEREKAAEDNIDQQLEEMEDEFLKEYRQKRMQEMCRTLANVPRFGKVFSLDATNFVDAIDKENPQVTIFVHIYDEDVEACETMNGCFACLAGEHHAAKFCRIRASDAFLSIKFAKKGIPAILVYKNGQLIGNFIRVSDDLGDDFFAVDVESFLQEHGFLLTSNSIKELQQPKITMPQVESDSGSDFELD